MKKYNFWIIVEEHDTEAKGRRFRDLDGGPQVSVGVDFPSIEAAHKAAKAIQRVEFNQRNIG